MRKTLIALSCFIISSLATAGLNYKILPGKYHTGGKVIAELILENTNQDLISANLIYDITKKPLVPISDEYLKGIEKLDLPADFIDERGYLNLELNGKLELETTTIYHLGRVDLGDLTNVHRVKLVAKSGRSITEIFYHPQLPDIGWAKLKMTIFPPIPIINNYTLEATLMKSF